MKKYEKLAYEDYESSRDDEGRDPIPSTIYVPVKEKYGY